MSVHRQVYATDRGFEVSAFHFGVGGFHLAITFWKWAFWVSF